MEITTLRTYFDTSQVGKGFARCSQIPAVQQRHPQQTISDDSADMLSKLFSGMDIMPVKPAVLEDDLFTMQKLEIAPKLEIE